MGANLWPGYRLNEQFEMQAKALAGNEAVMTFGAVRVFGNVAKQCARGWCDDLICSHQCCFYIGCVCVERRLQAALLLSDQDLLTGNVSSLSVNVYLASRE